MARSQPRQVCSGAYNEELSMATKKLLNDAVLESEVGILVGRCRFLISMEKTTPRPAETVQITKKSIRLFNELTRCLDAIPEEIRMYMSESLQSINLGAYEEFEHSINYLSAKFQAAAEIAVKRLDDCDRSGGKPPSYYGRQLLSGISWLLELKGVPVTKAAQIAFKIVIFENIGYRPSEAKVREIIRNFRKKHPIT